MRAERGGLPGRGGQIGGEGSERIKTRCPLSRCSLGPAAPSLADVAPEAPRTERRGSAVPSCTPPVTYSAPHGCPRGRQRVPNARGKGVRCRVRHRRFKAAGGGRGSVPPPHRPGGRRAAALRRLRPGLPSLPVLSRPESGWDHRQSLPSPPGPPHGLRRTCPGSFPI